MWFSAVQQNIIQMYITMLKKKMSSELRQNTLLSVMTAVTFPLRPPHLAFAICWWRWQNDVYKNKV